MKLYHRTYHPNAILASGFQDWTGTYMTRNEHTGVWFADRPLDENEGARGDIVLVVEVPDDVAESYEWVQDIGYREFLIPAEIANQYARRWLGTKEIGPSTKPFDEQTVSQSTFLLHVCCTPKTNHKNLKTKRASDLPILKVAPTGFEPVLPP